MYWLLLRRHAGRLLQCMPCSTHSTTQTSWPCSNGFYTVQDGHTCHRAPPTLLRRKYHRHGNTRWRESLLLAGRQKPIWRHVQHLSCPLCPQRLTPCCQVEWWHRSSPPDCCRQHRHLLPVLQPEPGDQHHCCWAKVWTAAAYQALYHHQGAWMPSPPADALLLLRGPGWSSPHRCGALSRHCCWSRLLRQQGNPDCVCWVLCS